MLVTPTEEMEKTIGLEASRRVGDLLPMVYVKMSRAIIHNPEQVYYSTAPDKLQWKELIRMPVYKDPERGTWFVELRYKDYSGKQRKHKKRGFRTQREAKEHEREFLSSIHPDSGLTLDVLCKLYLKDAAARLKPTTLNNQTKLIDRHITPRLGSMYVTDITVGTVREWQNELLLAGYKETYLHTIHAQFSAVFNFGMRFCGVTCNPVKECGSIGSKRPDEEMQFWTVEEFSAFASAIKKKKDSYALFTLLFWTGMRIGEALALTSDDFEFSSKKVRITKTYARIKGVDYILPPKTKKSLREIDLPDFLCDIMRGYINSLYRIPSDERIFPCTRGAVEKILPDYAKLAGVKKIRIHDLRHSHASMLIEMNAPILLISQRLGHENVETTLQIYSHLYPSRMDETIRALETAYRKCPQNAPTEQEIIKNPA